MNQLPPSYQKLSGKFFTPFIKTSMWKGPDHLLWVEGAVVMEHYKRFYYDDIQALVLIGNNDHHLWTFIWGSLMLLCGIIALSVSGPPYGSGFFTIFWALLLVINLYQGPCCKVYLKTAVQQENLRHLVRIRKANKILNQIKSLVEERQGVLDPSFLSQSGIVKNPSTPGPVVSGSASQQKTGLTGFSAKIQHPSLHWVLYGVLVLVGLAKSVQIWLNSPGLRILEYLCLALLLVLSISVLVRQKGKKKHRLLFVFGWITLGLAFLQAITVYILFVTTAFKNPAMAYNSWELMKIFFNKLNEGDPMITGLSFGFGLLNLLVGLSGMAALLGKKKIS
ncbi:MAG: hypothetical protein FP816_19200 [Desulfobacteraceae bacterium]|nr:hypothetical protein [Desulfobacteraceae bacterium]